MSSCFSRCLRVPIAMRTFYESSLWILQHFLPAYPDLHHGLLSPIGQVDPIRIQNIAQSHDALQLMHVGTARYRQGINLV